MNKADVVAFAKALGLKKIDKDKRTGWVIASCPMARWDHEKGTDHSPSFAIRYGKKKDFCHCLSCDFSGDLDYLLLRLALRTKGNSVAASRIMAARKFVSDKPVLSIGDDEEDEEDPNEVNEWPEWYIAGFHPAYDHEYLQSRKGGPIPYEVAEMMDFRYDAKRKRLGVPVRDFDGRLMGFHGRTVIDHDLKYLAYLHNKTYNRVVWFGEHWVDLSKPVLVAESLFDLARVLQVYRNAITPLMANFPKAKVLRISAATRVVAMLDNDKAGKAGAQKLMKYLPDTKFIVPEWPAGYKDPGDMPVHIVQTVLKKYLPLDEIIKA